MQTKTRFGYKDKKIKKVVWKHNQNAFKVIKSMANCAILV